MNISSVSREKPETERHNNAQYLRREVLIRVARAYLQGDLEDQVNRIPFAMRPKKSDAPFRCCIYKERAILRLRTLGALGFPVEGDDDFTPLSEYANQALRRSGPNEPVLTVIDIACKGCVSSRYFVTELCQGCLARPCAVNCNFGAVSLVNGRAVIDPSRCKNCGRCMTLCPYQAIVKIHVPCEEACPVNAIHKGDEGHAIIDFDKCTSCGRCMRACPFGAIMERSQIIDILRVLAASRKDGRKVVALVAPAIVGQFPVPFEKIAGALIALGFADVVPVAAGADLTTLHESAEFRTRMKSGKGFMTTSCCPAYVQTVRKHIPELLPFVSDTPTPMHYAAELARKKYPDSVTVFIGPCVAKRSEGIHDELIDYVMTFEETGALFVAAEIEPASVPACETEYKASWQGHGFAVTGGVASAVESLVRHTAPDSEEDSLLVTPISVNGLSPAGIKQLKSFACEGCPGNLVEVMACEGGCIGGAGTVGNPKIAAREIKCLVAKSASLEDLTKQDVEFSPCVVPERIETEDT
ncbi:MAG: 4Fe-4S dicluster domain-containing protein [Planctomycetia bacterium]|nr:4Fe-4S dicluster domain-containing protein [Planctomycetia bacterium]